MSRRYYRWIIKKSAPEPRRRSQRAERTQESTEPSPLGKIGIPSPSALSTLPFRWDIPHREQLGSLLEGEMESAYAEFRNELIDAGARILGFAGDARLVFVGRSPESLFDLMRGILRGTSWQGRAHLLPFSLHLMNPYADLPKPAELAAYRDLLRALGLLPEQILSSPLPVAFVDIVASGGSFYSLIALLKRFTEEDRTDWNAVRKKIRIVGICRQKETSPNTWRWQQHAPWLTELMGGTRYVTNVSVGALLYHYLADHQPKTTPSYPPKCWGKPTKEAALSSQSRLPSLRLARSLYEEGVSRQGRRRSVAALRRHRAMREPWLRHLSAELTHRAGIIAGDRAG